MTAVDKAPDAWVIVWESQPDVKHVMFGVESDFVGWGPNEYNLHDAEPLYTLPNALRALASDGSPEAGERRRKHHLAMSSLFNMAEELDPPTAGPEPVGGAIATDRDGDVWVPGDGEWFMASDEDRRNPETWKSLSQSFGPITVWRAEARS